MRIRNLFLFVPVVLLMACETQIYPELEAISPGYVVDAFIDNAYDTQVVRLSLSQSYFDASVPAPVSGATVTVVSEDDIVYNFIENAEEPGAYIWVPTDPDATFGEIGKAYTLLLSMNDEHFTAYSKMGRVPEIDSISFEPTDRINGKGVYYTGQFWARDPAGVGDTYWIKAYKNGQLLNKPGEINLAYDAAFSKGGQFDGVTFIQPIRNGISPFDTDDNNELISPYSPGDSVFVEIHAITEATFDFLTQVVVETNRPGGFGELFSRPLSNVSTNINRDSPVGTRVHGFFNVGAVSTKGRRFNP